MANTLNSNKYLDLIGLAKFWERVKAVVKYCIIEIETNHSKDSSNADIEWVKITSAVTTQDPNDGGVKTTYTIDDTKINEKFISVDTAIATETSERKAADALLAGDSWDSSSATWNTNSVPTHSNITNISATLEDHASKIQSLVQATEFVGVVDWDPEEATITKGEANPIQLFEVKIGSVSKGTYRAGDIIVFGDKEYILDGDVNNDNENNDPRFIELGDTTAEAERLTAIETWIGTPISFGDIDNVFGGKVSIPDVYPPQS